MKSIEYVKQKIDERIQIQETIIFCRDKKLKMFNKEIAKKHESNGK